MKRSHRHLLRRTLGIAIGAVVVIGVFIGWAWWRSSQSPVWYAPADSNSGEIEARGEYLENQLITQFHKIRSTNEETWTLELDEEWINAWLATRFPLWAQNRSLSAANMVEGLDVSLVENEIRFGLTLPGVGGGRIVSLSCKPRIEPAGQLEIDNAIMRLGRLAVPMSWVADSIGVTTGEFAPAQAILDGQPVDAVIRLSDGRSVRILELSIETGRMTLVLETVR